MQQGKHRAVASRICYDSAGRLWKKGYGNGDVAWHNYDGWDIVVLVNTWGAIHECYTRGVSIGVAGGVGVIGYARFELVHDLNSLRHDFDDCARRCRERETK